ncbi:hypothetical protein AYI69_g5599 [Smittium culicis]|uniref:Uncharacterized protein n=1 Tax=Smittium culicis TaxID=133412 RepID=A0A1R1Y5D2_9FUNG|nr:hypothetical protein AYI69_g5599 [Smittium culicis]
MKNALRDDCGPENATESAFNEFVDPSMEIGNMFSGYERAYNVPKLCVGGNRYGLQSKKWKLSSHED